MAADQPWQEREPESIATICMDDPKCMRDFQAQLARDEARSTGGSGYGWLPLLVLAIVLWLVFFRKR
jgi:hypothetical protein